MGSQKYFIMIGGKNSPRAHCLRGPRLHHLYSCRHQHWSEREVPEQERKGMRGSQGWENALPRQGGESLGMGFRGRSQLEVKLLLGGRLRGCGRR